jgi:hypothetical protein
MDKHAKRVDDLLELFSQVLYRIPEDNRRLALALFKAATAVVLHGGDQIGSEFAQRALSWNSERKTRSGLATTDMLAFQVVERIRRDAKLAGKSPPPLSRLNKKNRRSAFACAAEELGSNESAVEGAYYRHQPL